MLIAGKGHEDYQIYGSERRPFSDQKVVAAALAVARGRCGMSRTLADFANSCGGTLKGADRAYTGVSTDTRTLKAGELFVALRGPRFNANDFVAAAADRRRGRRGGRHAASTRRWRRSSLPTRRLR